MIQWVFDLLAALINFFLSLFPDMPPIQSLAAQIASGVSTISSYASKVGEFVPWSLVTGCMATIFAALIVGFIIKVVRIVASFLTAGGGSAA